MSVHCVRTTFDGEECVVEITSTQNLESIEAAQAARELALHIAEILADTPAAETLVLNIQDLSPFADFFVICSGENERQIRAIAREIAERLADDGVRPERVEGTPNSGWMLLDYGATIVHIFSVEQRQYYRIEEIWSEAPTLVAMQ
jgi:ribosome-associated protein